MSKSLSELEELRSQWTELYSKTLPSLARAKDSAQNQWPVTLDHCFARIILDNTVGRKGDANVVPWDTIIKRPAVKSMNQSQLRDAINLGEKIWSGEVNLAELDKISLRGRGKNEKRYSNDNEFTKKRPRPEASGGQLSPAKKAKTQATLPFATKDKEEPKQLLSSSSESATGDTNQTPTVDFEKTMQRIYSHPSLTPYRKRLYATLLTVPRGEFTTYQAMADFMNSSARAVGNGMRHNPFAPDVPCHRVMASDRSLGGFMGDWGKDGRYANKKIQLLAEEGVKFDSNGKVRGPVFRAFQMLEVPDEVKTS